jgi:hypothetical protein
MPLRLTRVSKRTHLDGLPAECIVAGSCQCGWGCAIEFFITPWFASEQNPVCVAAGVCQCDDGWECDPIQPMPTPNDAIHLHTVWNASATVLTDRLLQLSLLSENLHFENKIVHLVR